MSKLVTREFYLARVQDHEAAAAECGDPMMRQIWQETAAAWLQVSQAPKAPRRRRPKAPANKPLQWETLMAAAPGVVGDAILDFRERDQIELVVGQTLLNGLFAGAATEVIFESHHAAHAETPLVQPVQDLELIL
jgi:hypothetical protein